MSQVSILCCLLPRCRGSGPSPEIWEEYRWCFLNVELVHLLMGASPNVNVLACQCACSSACEIVWVSGCVRPNVHVKGNVNGCDSDCHCWAFIHIGWLGRNLTIARKGPLVYPTIPANCLHRVGLTTWNHIICQYMPIYFHTMTSSRYLSCDGITSKISCGWCDGAQVCHIPEQRHPSRAPCQFGQFSHHQCRGSCARCSGYSTKLPKIATDCVIEIVTIGEGCDGQMQAWAIFAT